MSWNILWSQENGSNNKFFCRNNNEKRNVMVCRSDIRNNRYNTRIYIISGQNTASTAFYAERSCRDVLYALLPYRSIFGNGNERCQYCTKYFLWPQNAKGLNKYRHTDNFRDRAVHYVHHHVGCVVFSVYFARSRHQYLLYVVQRSSERQKEHYSNLTHGSDVRYFRPIHRRKHLRDRSAYLCRYRSFQKQKKDRGRSVMNKKRANTVWTAPNCADSTKTAIMAENIKI